MLTLAVISLASSGDHSFDFNFFLDHSVDKELVIDQSIRIYQYHSSSPWRTLFSSYKKGIKGVLFCILIRGDVDEIVIILGQGNNDEIVVILGRSGRSGQSDIDEFLSVESVEGIWLIEAKISDIGEGRLFHGVLGLDEDWNDIDKDVDEGRLFRDVLGWDDIDENRLFYGG
ncbi:hypothetical protein C1645_826469 [Glomus cerebriforme]|uniref:Uncharacterized protein n=1 Tax=Glomus cerebriforme TaxID=658196 RepID=A0A397STU7_9GLOM|nr:hypothetical protein C1645_826469 [Glomus cerebriforme]